LVDGGDPKIENSAFHGDFFHVEQEKKLPCAYSENYSLLNG
jgi:hypothetical protein